MPSKFAFQFQNNLIGGLAGAAIGAGGTALLSSKDPGESDEDFNRRRINNAITGALAGSATGVGISVFQDKLDWLGSKVLALFKGDQNQQTSVVTHPWLGPAISHKVDKAWNDTFGQANPWTHPDTGVGAVESKGIEAAGAGLGAGMLGRRLAGPPKTLTGKSTSGGPTDSWGTVISDARGDLTNEQTKFNLLKADAQNAYNTSFADHNAAVDRALEELKMQTTKATANPGIFNPDLQPAQDRFDFLSSPAGRTDVDAARINWEGMPKPSTLSKAEAIEAELTRLRQTDKGLEFFNPLRIFFGKQPIKTRMGRALALPAMAGAAYFGPNFLGPSDPGPSPLQ